MKCNVNSLLPFYNQSFFIHTQPLLKIFTHRYKKLGREEQNYYMKFSNWNFQQHSCAKDSECYQ